MKWPYSCASPERRDVEVKRWQWLTPAHAFAATAAAVDHARSALEEVAQKHEWKIKRKG